MAISLIVFLVKLVSLVNLGIDASPNTLYSLFSLNSLSLAPKLFSYCKVSKKLKTESGKRKTFVFRFTLGVENGTDAKPRAGCACTLCRGAKEEKPAQAGLKRKAENFMAFSHWPLAIGYFSRKRACLTRCIDGLLVAEVV